MIFSLRGFRAKAPAPSLGGANIRYKPVIPITVIGPSSQEVCEILMDSGADDIVFPEALAARIGIDLSKASSGQAQGVGTAQPVGLLYACVILLLSDQTEVYRWRTVVGFTRAPLRFPLFGIAGGWEHFRITLDVADREIHLVPKPTLPTTQDPFP